MLGQNEINQDDFYDFCKKHASQEFVDGLHYWLDQYEFNTASPPKE